MRIIILFLAVFLVAACISEVKPILKPAQIDISNRITDLQKWLAQDVAAKSIPPGEAKPIEDQIKQVKEKYEKLQTDGKLTPKDSKEIGQTLDKISDTIFRLDQKKKRGSFKGGPS